MAHPKGSRVMPLFRKNSFISVFPVTKLEYSGGILIAISDISSCKSAAFVDLRLLCFDGIQPYLHVHYEMVPSHGMVTYN